MPKRPVVIIPIPSLGQEERKGQAAPTPTWREDSNGEARPRRWWCGSGGWELAEVGPCPSALVWKEFVLGKTKCGVVAKRSEP